MATGVKPRDEESKLSRADLDIIQDAMKNKKFRDLLAEYCEEIRDPANQAVYQKEMVQLEKERGYDVTFINPKGGYVIKTSVAGDRKAFVNICSNENIDKPSCKVQEVDGQKGMNWQLPYSIIPPREDYNSKKERCVIYDVVFHPDTLRMAEVNKRFRDLVNKTAFEGLQKTYNINLDLNNTRFPKSHYKGMSVPAVIRKEDPNYKPTEDSENQHIDPGLEQLYPQHVYSPNVESSPSVHPEKNTKDINSKCTNIDFMHTSNDGYTIPKYVIKQQKNVDLQEFTYSKDSKHYTAIPSHIIVEVNLPLLSSTKECVLDVRERDLTMISEKPAKYKLNIKLPYPVNEESGKAQFDKTKHLLVITLPVVKRTLENTYRADSGIESEEHSGSHSEEESKELIVELNSTDKLVTKPTKSEICTDENFLLPTLGYILPAYTYNMLDDIVAFTFHVKNTDPASVEVRNCDNKIQIKFSSMGSGFVPVHYAAILIFPNDVKFHDATGEAWDNNVILQLEIAEKPPTQFEIGLNENSMKKESFDISKVKANIKPDNTEILPKIPEESVAPVVEVTNLGTETNILVSSSNQRALEEEIRDSESDLKETDIKCSESYNNENGAKPIYRKPIAMMRSYSESSYGDVASSMDYISSDCIPGESSLKKTVRFKDEIKTQFYRYNSSIEGQKKKNQRKKSKKRHQHKSESEAEDEFSNVVQMKPRLKSALKQRRDSGLADTSDADVDNKMMSDLDMYNSATETDENSNENDANTENQGLDMYNNGKTNANPSHRENKKKSPKKGKRGTMTDNIKHNTELYDPNKLNKGQYLEVKFKNDLIFDLDM